MNLSPLDFKNRKAISSIEQSPSCVSIRKRVNLALLKKSKTVGKLAFYQPRPMESRKIFLQSAGRWISASKRYEYLGGNQRRRINQLTLSQVASKGRYEELVENEILLT
jgi:hypothetical protein